MRSLVVSFLMFSALGLSACGKGFKAANNSLDSGLGYEQYTTLKLGVLGDSISRGYDIKQLFAEDIDNNWASGRDLPESLSNRLYSVMTPEPGTIALVQPKNLAVTGGTVMSTNSALLAKAAELASDSPDVVAIEIGANDVCGGFLNTAASITQFQQKILAVLQVLLSSPKPPKLISLASIPNIYNLTQIPQLASNNLCQQAWALTCSNLSIGQTAFQAQWNSANQALAAAAVQAGAKVVFDGGALANASFSLDEVSGIDCFHPSVKGQAKIATAVWGTITPHLGSIFTN